MFMLQYSNIVEFVAISILFFLYIHYWRRNRGKIVPSWPIIGMVLTILRYVPDFHNFTTLVLKRHGGTFQFEGPWFTNTSFTGTSDPKNIDHVTNKNFGNYGKGSNFKEILDVLGGSILNLDFHEWKLERTVNQLIFKRKNFQNFFHRSVQKKVENYLLPFLNDVSEAGAQVDLQDVLNRFTFDITCTIAYGFDPNCLPNKFSKLREIASLKSLPVMEEVIFYRHFIPIYLRKLQKWLNVGQEKKFKVAQENIDRFLYECMSTYSSRCGEEFDVCYFDLVKELTKEGYGRGEMSETYVRDTGFSLLIAGNGTISSGLSWFFWLVSIHPVVQAKIIDEINENCHTQYENCIASREEDLDKLVYLHAALCEALRLYPPIPFEHICSVKSDILPSGDHVSENTKLMYSMYAMGRMEQIWGEDCMEFKPERWISNKGYIIHVPSFKFLTFNTGPRSCLGKDLSFVQMKMVAATILWKFQIKVVEGHPVMPRISIILRMKHGLKVEVTKRCI
ncbi:alkane hydroxylase MAH1-like [Trifolium pratense]|uniref:alkane hydroxylase MAH1-like n=1 Tax=Trifolium pratense TaxID=57577 RepID=UPI001E6973AC|nr:alkane hydroxylase MAH1-like [Trifolium pratense]